MKLIDGKKVAQEIQTDIAYKISQLKGRKPGLAVILVGENPASQSYVRSKKKACASTGMVSIGIELPSSISQSDLIKEIEKLNRDPNVDGILVQLPLPPHIDEQAITAAIDPNKDVDGFHPVNVGKMLLGDESGFLPCTPHGIKILLQRSQIPIEGKHVVIVGRSNIVGKPLAAILMQKKPHCNATVTVVHSQSENLKELTRSADILVAAIGRPFFISKEMVKPHSTVIDVGINRLHDGRLVGDVDFQNVSEVVDHITPVPGGIGPMTIAMLLQNTLLSFLKLMLLLICISSCQKAPHKKVDPCTHFMGKSMTLPYHLTIGKTLSNNEQNQIQTVIDQTFADIHKTFDNWNPDSEISKLNLAPKEAHIPLSPQMQDLLALCGQIVSLSGGRFDPTIEPLAQLWQNDEKPNQEAVQAACDSIGWNHISIHNGILKKDCDGTRLDLCGISKGIFIDWLVERLQKLGYHDLIVEWAGEIRAIGHHPDNRDWAVPVDPRFTMNKQKIAPIPLRDCAMAVSGNSCRNIVDPLTAAPPELTAYSIASAMVLAPTCALADALATAAMLFHNRKEAETWAQEVVTLYPDVKFWIIAYH